MVSNELLDKHKDLMIIDDWWWSSEDIPAYDYLKEAHANELQFIFPYLSSNRIAIQAGGHCGYVPLYLSNYFKTVYTFEPNFSFFTALCLNIPNDNVFKFQACLGEKSKSVAMQTNPGFPSGANYVKGHGKIPMLTIDSFNLESCDLIMLDTEGYEYNILLGAQKTIKKHKPVLCIERYWGIRTLGETAEDDMNKFLEDNGYGLSAKKIHDSDYIYMQKG